MLCKYMRKARRAPRRLIKGKGKKKFSRRYRRSARYKATVPGSCTIKDGVITWRLPRKIRSMNVLASRLARHGDTKAWEQVFTEAKIVETDHSLGPCTRQRLKLEIVRLAPTKAFFLDRTNLAGGVKGLEDFLVRAEYLVDDCEEWEDGPYCSQGLSEDKKYWAVIRLSVAETNAPTT